MTWEEDRVAEEPTVPQCLHHWVIETVDGASKRRRGKDICQLRGAEHLV